MASHRILLIIMKLLIIIIIEDGIEEKIGPASAGSAGPAATALYYSEIFTHQAEII